MVFARKNCDFPWLCQFTGVSETSSSLWAPNFRDILRVRQWSFSIYIYIYICIDEIPDQLGETSRENPEKASQNCSDFMLKSRFTSQLANFWSRPLEASIPSSTKKRHSGQIWPFFGGGVLLPTWPTYLSPKRCVSRCSRTWGVFSSGWPLPRIHHLRCTSLPVRPTARFTWWTTSPRSVAPVHPHQANGPCKNLKIWRRYNGPYWECLWYHEMVRMVKTSRKLVKTQQEVGWFQVSLRRLLKCPKKKDLRWINLGDGKKSGLTILPNKNKVGWSGWVFYNLCIDMLWFSMLEIKVLFRQKGATSRFVSPKHCHPEAPEESLK